MGAIVEPRTGESEAPGHCRNSPACASRCPSGESSSTEKKGGPRTAFFYRYSISSIIVRSRGSTTYVLLSRSI
jgi:hypothetical protein